MALSILEQLRRDLPGQLEAIPALRDDDLLDQVRQVEAIGRVIDARRLMLAAQVAERSRSELGSESLAVRQGFRKARDLLQDLTLASGRTVADRIRLGQHVSPRRTLDGHPLPATFPVAAVAVAQGDLGSDQLDAITAPLLGMSGGLSTPGIDRAEQELVGTATGSTELPPMLSPSADMIRRFAFTWVAFLDPDGLEPDYEQAVAARGFSMGRRKGMSTSFTLTVPTDQAATIENFLQAHLNPQTASVCFLPQEEIDRLNAEELLDSRTRVQKRADVIVGTLDAAARAKDAPRIGGAAPTPLITARLSDLQAGRGAGFIEGQDHPVPISVVQQAVCSGGFQLAILDDKGAVLYLGVKERFFSTDQRRAMAARDGGCINCGAPLSMT